MPGKKKTAPGNPEAAFSIGLLFCLEDAFSTQCGLKSGLIGVVLVELRGNGYVAASFGRMAIRYGNEVSTRRYVEKYYGIGILGKQTLNHGHRIGIDQGDGVVTESARCWFRAIDRLPPCCQLVGAGLNQINAYQHIWLNERQHIHRERIVRWSGVAGKGAYTYKKCDEEETTEYF